MSTVIKRLKQGNQQFVPVTLAEAVVVNTAGIGGTGQITTLDKVLQSAIGQTNNYLIQINNKLAELASSKQDKLVGGVGIEITDDNRINVTLNQTLYQVVQELPNPSVNTMNMIYIVPLIASEDAQNLCAEYICVYDGQGYRWEQFGTFKTDVGLSGYVTEEELHIYSVTAESVKNSAGLPIGVNYDIPDNLYADYV